MDHFSKISEKSSVPCLTCKLSFPIGIRLGVIAELIRDDTTIPLMFFELMKAIIWPRSAVSVGQSRTVILGKSGLDNRTPLRPDNHH